MNKILGRKLNSGSLEKTTQVTSGRSWMEKLIAASITSVALFFILYLPDRDDGSGSLLGAFFTFIAVVLGMTALDKSRPLPKRSVILQFKLISYSLGLGVAIGIANLSFNFGMALLDSAIYEQMVARWTEFSAWSIMISGPVMEEIIFRLLLMSMIAWFATRFTDNRKMIFYIAVGVSSLLFGIAHIFYGGVNTLTYQVAIAVKSGGLSLFFGWVFWRWGLPYSIISHCSANAIHLLLWPLLF